MRQGLPMGCGTHRYVALRLVLSLVLELALLVLVQLSLETLEVTLQLRLSLVQGVRSSAHVRVQVLPPTLRTTNGWLLDVRSGL